MEICGGFPTTWQKRAYWRLSSKGTMEENTQTTLTLLTCLTQLWSQSWQLALLTLGWFQTTLSLQVPGHAPVWNPQYRLKPKQEMGIKHTLIDLLNARVLQTCTSPWKTPVFPIPKAENKGREVNNATLAAEYPIPDHYLLLHNLNSSHKFFHCHSSGKFLPLELES